MGFHESTLPDGISYGARAGPGWKNRVIDLPDSGQDEVVEAASSPRFRYDIGYGIKKPVDLATVKTFLLARRGAANGFRMRDWTDYTSGATGSLLDGGTISHQDVVIGVGNGTQTQFQIVKKYVSDAQTYTRTIRKPRTGTVVVALAGVQQTSGWTVDVTTGIVTFSTPPANGVQVKAGFEYDVPVRLERDTDDWMAITIEHYSGNRIESILLVEILDPVGDTEEYPYRGSTRWGAISANWNIALTNGFTQTWAPSVGGLIGFLPETDDIPDGGLHLVVKNEGSFSFDVKSASGVTVGSVGVGAVALIALLLDSTGAKTWLLK